MMHSDDKVLQAIESMKHALSNKGVVACYRQMQDLLLPHLENEEGTYYQDIYLDDIETYLEENEPLRAYKVLEEMEEKRRAQVESE